MTGVEAATARVAEVLRELHELPAVAQALAAAPRAVTESLPQVLAASDFVAESCVRDPDVIPALLAGALLSRRSAADFAAISATEGTHSDEADFQAWIRRWRRREMVRIAWRDLAGWASLEETLAELDNAEEACVERLVELGVNT